MIVINKRLVRLQKKIFIQNKKSLLQLSSLQQIIFSTLNGRIELGIKILKIKKSLS